MPSGRPVLINDVAVFDGRSPPARPRSPAARIDAVADIARIWRGGAPVQGSSYGE